MRPPFQTLSLQHVIVLLIALIATSPVLATRQPFAPPHARVTMRPIAPEALQSSQGATPLRRGAFQKFSPCMRTPPLRESLVAVPLTPTPIPQEDTRPAPEVPQTPEQKPQEAGQYFVSISGRAHKAREEEREQTTLRGAYATRDAILGCAILQCKSNAQALRIQSDLSPEEKDDLLERACVYEEAANALEMETWENTSEKTRLFLRENLPKWEKTYQWFFVTRELLSDLEEADSASTDSKSPLLPLLEDDPMELRTPEKAALIHKAAPDCAPPLKDTPGARKRSRSAAEASETSCGSPTLEALAPHSTLSLLPTSVLGDAI